ncbi:hypothetical protein PROFUN_14273 [Planoprotostelium fungivorum]|uniref:Phospho-2-dehydro-3-deoxyheptonate aldolase n=1 Tax=Planoprotostelium fungivorum TaxID=1890364 RepID=A0A2P6N0G9_9EUKA|nr:hypothetical protein PROFUN_14273 [Planoprotostelium fungivorum]
MDPTATQGHSKEWSPESWKTFPIKQQPDYADPEAVKKAVSKVRQLPPLVHHKEIRSLKNYLAKAAQGKAFLLQGGDCAERFIDCSQKPIEDKFKILLQMSLVIIYGARVPVVRLARMAGQFAKPRTSNYETVNGNRIPSFKGDNINDYDISKREPDPDRMVQAYFHSAATLNYIRAMISGGVADLHNPRAWILDHVKEDATRREYETMIEQITDNISFFDLLHDHRQDENLSKVEFFTSHEGLLLEFESALTKQIGGKHYNLGAHFLWIGDRTRDIDGAHVEYFRGIANPIGIKLGPTSEPDIIIKLIHLLNPDKEEGKLTLITRYGADQVEKLLPIHIQAAKSTGVPVLWICDPCHGNTETSPSGVKTRNVERMSLELIRTFQIHQKEGSRLGGVHLEMTGDNVTECIGGSIHLDHPDLTRNYETFCDPRLNYTQSLDIAFTISQHLKEKNVAMRKMTQ